MGMKSIALLLLLTTSASAQMWQPVPPDNMPSYGAPPPVKSVPTQSITVMPFDHPAFEPDEATKIWALKRAYQLNGNSMVGSTIDLSNESPSAVVVPTEKVVPVTATPEDEKQTNLDKLQKKWVKLRGSRILASNICEEHHMHKVFTPDHKSWHCK